jgi:hypothetical protein
MIEAELVFGGLEAIFDRPAVAFDGDERLDFGSSRTPGREVGQITVADIAADQEAPGPDA